MQIIDIFLSVGVARAERKNDRPNWKGNSIPLPVDFSGIETIDSVNEILSSAHDNSPSWGASTICPGAVGVGCL